MAAAEMGSSEANILFKVARHIGTELTLTIKGAGEFAPWQLP